MGWFKDLLEGLRNYGKTPRPNPGPPPKKPHNMVSSDLPVVAPEFDIEIPDDTRQWAGIVWHHSYSTDNDQTNNWRAIKKFHTSYRYKGDIISAEEYWDLKGLNKKGLSQPWSDIGYHAGIERDKGKLCWKIGRPWNRSGAHAGNKNFNSTYLGLCIIGNFDKRKPGKKQWAMALEATRALMEKFGFSESMVLGHREVYDRLGKPRQKTCPGSKWDMDKFRAEL